MSRSENHDQRNDAMRQAFLTPFEFAAAAPGTNQQILSTVEKLGLEHTEEEISKEPHVSKIHWIGNRKAEKVLLYFHGGGFTLPILEGHVKFLAQSVDHLKSAGKDLCLAVLEYTLCPTARYPVQIQQACNALHHLLAQGYEPSNILVGGDSAGGNLSLAVLSAISHPFDGVKPFKLDDKLAGALLISPWVSFETDTPSWKDNHGKDVVSLETVNLLIPAYAKPNEFNNHSEPLRAPNDWWKDAPVRNILNVYGDFEVLRDHQAQFSQKLAESGAKVQDSKCSTQVHIDNILDAQTDLETGEMTDVIWKWLGQVV